jgi:hypothetical protein
VRTRSWWFAVQVASHYYYHLHATTDRFHWRAAQHPLEEWVAVSPDGQDVQTQFISGVYGGANASTYRLAADHLRTVRDPPISLWLRLRRRGGEDDTKPI